MFGDQFTNFSVNTVRSLYIYVAYIPNMAMEIKIINGKQYEYDVPMVWDTDHMKKHKVSRYIVKIVDGIPIRVREIVAGKGIYEIGHLELVWSLMPDIIENLKKTFPDDHMKMLALPSTGSYIHFP